MWGKLVHGSAGLKDFPCWVQMLPGIFFKCIDLDSEWTFVALTMILQTMVVSFANTRDRRADQGPVPQVLQGLCGRPS